MKKEIIFTVASRRWEKIITATIRTQKESVSEGRIISCMARVILRMQEQGLFPAPINRRETCVAAARKIGEDGITPPILLNIVVTTKEKQIVH